jgi:hypothetical protein
MLQMLRSRNMWDKLHSFEVRQNTHLGNPSQYRRSFILFSSCESCDVEMRSNICGLFLDLDVEIDR